MRDRFVVLDADQTLSRFMRGDLPDTELFDDVVGTLLRKLAVTGRRMRAYGEMVALLWARGNVAGALALEDRWNALQESVSFSLMCAYPISDAGAPLAEGLSQIRARHNHHF